MSLVHDALEKAKREASAKNAKELGLPETRLGAGQPFRAGRRISPIAVAAIAATITLAAVGAFLLLTRSTSRGAPASAPSSTVEAKRAPAATVATPPAAAPPAPANPAPAAAPTRNAAATAVATPAQPPLSDAPLAKPSTAIVVAPLGAPQAPKSAGVAIHVAPAPSQDSKTPSFVRQLTLEDGTVIRLGGIAWSEEAPLAYLNGRLYGKGESVSGLIVERIEKESVLLRGGRGPVLLTLH